MLSGDAQLIGTIESWLAEGGEPLEPEEFTMCDIACGEMRGRIAIYIPREGDGRDPWIEWKVTRAGA